MKIAWDRETNEFLLHDGKRLGTPAPTGHISIPAAQVSRITLQDWLAVLGPAEDSIKQTVVVTLEEAEESVVLMHCGDTIGVSIGIKCPHWDDAYFGSVLKKLCSRSDDLVDSFSYEYDEWIVGLFCNADTRTPFDLFKLQSLYTEVLQVPPDRRRSIGDLSVDTLVRLVEVGGVELLVGAQESSWLEFKSMGYDLTSFAPKIELAQDICRFANGNHAALLLLGFRTKKYKGFEAVEKVVPLAIQAGAEARYRAVIDAHVYPPISGLEVKQIPVGGGAVLAICIPVQPNGRKPYLTHGAVVDGKNEGSFISIIERRDEGSRPMSVPEIHALLVAGRHLLGQADIERSPTQATTHTSS